MKIKLNTYLIKLQNPTDTIYVQLPAPNQVKARMMAYRYAHDFGCPGARTVEITRLATLTWKKAKVKKK